MFDFKLRKHIPSVDRHSRDFEIDAHIQSVAQRLVIQGPSGSGKTLILKMLVGLIRPDAGHVRIADRTVYGSQKRIFVPVRERRIAYVFQEYYLFPHLTVAQNLEFAFKKGVINPSRRQCSETTVKWAERLGIAHVLSHYPDQLSGGQAQRTALLRAVLSQPTAILLDEPFSALDTDTRSQIRELLLNLQEELQLPMIMVSHDKEDTAFFAQAVYRLREGKLCEH